MQLLPMKTRNKSGTSLYHVEKDTWGVRKDHSSMFDEREETIGETLVNREFKINNVLDGWGTSSHLGFSVLEFVRYYTWIQCGPTETRLIG